MSVSIAYSPSCVSESDARKVLAYIDTLVDYAWERYGKFHAPDPDIYRDAAHHALVKCLENWDGHTKQFPHYAYPRIKGAVCDALEGYMSWRYGRSQTRGYGHKRASAKTEPLHIQAVKAR